MDQADIIVTGSELTSGRVSDVNGPFLARQLAAMGIPCAGIRIIGDHPEELARQIQQARAQSRLVLLSGGLGPTGDDLTRQVLSEAFGLPLVDAPPMDAHVSYPIPEGAVQIANPKGSAPGIWLEQHGRALVALPGVPWELTAMWPETARRITPLFNGVGRLNRYSARVVGLTERQVERAIDSAFQNANHPPLEIGLSAKPLAVDVHLAHADMALLERASDIVRAALGDHIFTEDDHSLAEVVGTLLKKRGKWVATAESCTGGALSAALTAVAGASAYVDRAVVSYSNDAKVSALGVPETLLDQHGAVSEPVARAMACGLLARSKADLTVSVTGIAGPGGGTEQKPVGTVVMALAAREGTFCHTFHHMGDRTRFVQCTVNRGMDLIRRYLAGGIQGLADHFGPRNAPHH